MEDEPVLLARKGKVLESPVRQNHIPNSDLDEAVRKAGLEGLQDVDLAMLEVSGEITIVPTR